MQKDINKRIDKILNSTQGSQRAKPKTDLLANIERQIYEVEVSIIPMSRIRLVAAAAAVMLLLNISILNNYLQNSRDMGLVEMEHATSLVTDFKLYD